MPLGDADAAPLLELSGIGKSYGGVVALHDVVFAARRHSIHAVLGENGAGKSTLIKIIGCVVQPDIGRVAVDGQRVQLGSPKDAVALGIVGVFQELSLIPDLSTAENICVTEAGWFKLVDATAQRHQAEARLAEVGCADLNPRLPVRELPLPRRQLIELANALQRRPRLLIVDEATSALTSKDFERAYAILRRLREEDVAILYISHRMHEIEALADTCSVFRSGRHIETFEPGTRSADAIVHMMIGREISQVYPQKPVRPAPLPPFLEVRELGWTDWLQGLSFGVGKGEIVGLGGLEGQGQRELLLGLFGVLRDLRGRVTLKGLPAVLDSPADAKAASVGFALLPEDRKSEGLILAMSVRENITLASLETLKDGQLQPAKGSAGQVAPDPAPSDSPHGPTRGIDVGTKQEFHRLMRSLADAGAAILFYSTDNDELLGMCDRVLVLYRGRIARELEGEAITEHNIVTAAFAMPVGRAA